MLPPNKLQEMPIKRQINVNLKKLIELGQKHYNVYQILSWHNILGTTDLEFYDSSFKRPRRYAKKSQSNYKKNFALDPSMLSRFALQIK